MRVGVQVDNPMERIAMLLGLVPEGLMESWLGPITALGGDINLTSTDAHRGKAPQFGAEDAVQRPDAADGRLRSLA